MKILNPKKLTPWKIHIFKPKSWRFCSDDIFDFGYVYVSYNKKRRFNTIKYTFSITVIGLVLRLTVHIFNWLDYIQRIPMSSSSSEQKVDVHPLQKSNN